MRGELRSGVECMTVMCLWNLALIVIGLLNCSYLPITKLQGLLICYYMPYM